MEKMNNDWDTPLLRFHGSACAGFLTYWARRCFSIRLNGGWRVSSDPVHDAGGGVVKSVREFVDAFDR
jgi:hypothetical protein